MATTTASISVSSNIMSYPISINKTMTMKKFQSCTGLELVDLGAGKLTEATAKDALHEALGTVDTSNYVYICNKSTDDDQYIVFGLHDTIIGRLGAGDWMFIPWNMSDADAEINIEAEPSGTIEYEYAIFKSTYTLPAKT